MTTTAAKNTGLATFHTIRVRTDSKRELIQFCEEYGVKLPRAIELLVAGWEKLTPNQKAACLQNR